jgi:cytochrome c5
MRTHRGCIVLVALLVTGGLRAQTSAPQASSFRDDARVTPVSGESWLNHLNRSFGDTSMGKTGRLGPGPQEEGNSLQQTQRPIFLSKDSDALHGADLYRLNCQGCHGESGLGAPPEINSVISPVRAMSVPLVLTRMKDRGMDISYAEASKLAQESKAALLDRLHKGGENMPAFPQLSDAEVGWLLSYLNHLAQVPGSSSDGLAVKESHVRVGELIVKSTCHTCHSAIGPNPGPQELMDGAIPPLSSLTTRKSQSEFVRKVTQGAPVLMGSPATLCRGRMPVFFYLTDEEAADVYLYLTLYSPIEATSDRPLVAASIAVGSQPGQGNSALPPPTPASTSLAAEDGESARDVEVEKTAISMTATMVAFALVGGTAFTFREFKRLSAETTIQSANSQNIHLGPGPSGQMQAVYRTLPLLYGDSNRSSQ